MSNRFKGRIALVTGASSGIGRACAELLAAEGADVIAVARSRDPLERLSADQPAIQPWVGNVADDALIARIEALERLDILINNAGSNQPQPIVDVDDVTLDRLLAVNVRAAFRVARAAVRVMRAGASSGTIVNMSSQMGHVGSPGRTVYCMTKHALEGLTKAMAVELGPYRIRVNAVAPTFVETPMTRPMLDDPAFSDFVHGMLVTGRLATVADVANAVAYLASDAAAMITGHSLRVDGGWTAH